jgi:hypothetical protein
MVSIPIVLFVYIFIVSSINEIKVEYSQLIHDGAELLPVVLGDILDISQYRADFRIMFKDTDISIFGGFAQVATSICVPENSRKRIAPSGDLSRDHEELFCDKKAGKNQMEVVVGI